ncbi:LacI family DNA-binding transcriptional regulator [Treponema zioleckii]|uniref:LacI family DNA-binding transcriptional regulator n=1 Tax=Treponema zioleckii TaxID=331680 RepID=UPI00168B0F11|nr:LacI family DNA-binding transcriptional regulator [Treponema zioleckii]
MDNRLHNKNYTMEDIALELGVAKSTVSRALADSKRISAETREKIQQFAKTHGFKPNLVARALAGQKTLNLAVVMPLEATAVQMMFFHECLSGIVTSAAKQGYSVLVCMTNDNGGDELLESLLTNHRVDGVILTQLLQEDKNLKIVREYGLPFVVIGSGAGDDVFHVDSRMKECCEEFTEMCAKKVCDGGRVLFVCGSLGIVANNNRLSGFLAGMENLTEKNLKYAVCSNYLDIGTEFDLKDWHLILCSDDVVCSKILEISRKHGFSIGEDKDFMLASFHDSIILESNCPGISALRVNAFGLGEKAGEVALKLLSSAKDGVECEIEKNNYVECSYEMREST